MDEIDKKILEELGLGESAEDTHYKPTENDKKLLKFLTEHTDKWRDYRDQNYTKDLERYERIFRGKWEDSDKTRESERSKVISPATQQAIETRHAEIMEAIFGQKDYFDIKDDVVDVNGTKLDVEKIKNQLKEDFDQDKIRKAIENIVLLAEISGTGIGEITVSTQSQYKMMQVKLDDQLAQYGVGETERACVKLTPVSLNNFIFDPNGTTVDDCMGVAVEKHVSIHKVVKGIKDGIYRDVDISTLYEDGSLEATKEVSNYREDKIKLLTYYGLVPKKYLELDDEAEDDEDTVKDEFEDYADMVEAICVVSNGSMILKAEPSPYTMKDRPIVLYQADTVPNRLLGRGTAEKAMNMQASIDGSIRSHMDGLALTSAPMMAMDATRVPRGFKMQVKPGNNVMVNGNPSEIFYPFKFGATDGAQMETSKEFERMLLMATGTMDSAGQASQVARDSNMDMATATMIKKYKRVLVNFQEDFLIPFINKALWRYMQFDPERYPSIDVKFVPTATLGIIAREYEQKQLAFLMQTLGADSPITPVLMQGILQNSSISNREELIEQMKQMSQPDRKQQELKERSIQLEMADKQSTVEKTQAETEKIRVETQLAPSVAQAKLVAALSNNLDEDNEGKDFDRRVKITELRLKEKDIESNETIAKFQMAQSGNDIQSKQIETAMKVDEHNMKKQELEMKKEELEIKRAGRKPMKITAPSGETYSAE